MYINNLPGENVDELKNTIFEIFNSFDNDSICFPGHGSEATIEYIRTSNKELEKFLNN